MTTSAPKAFYVAAAVSTSLRRPTSFAPPTRSKLRAFVVDEASRNSSDAFIVSWFARQLVVVCQGSLLAPSDAPARALIVRPPAQSL